MEDKYKPSKEFTDQSWSQMKALLDKEMPDKGAILLTPDQGKRNKLFLLLSLLLLLSVAALFIYYQSNSGLSENLNIEKNDTTELALIQPKQEFNSTNKEAEIGIKKNETISENTAKNIQKSDLSRLNAVKNNSKRNTVSSKSFNGIKANHFTVKTAIATRNREETQTTIFEKEIPVNEKIDAGTPFILNSEKYYDTMNENLKEGQKEENQTVVVLEGIDSRDLELLIFEEEQNVEKFADLKKLKNKLPLFAFVGARNYDFSSNIDFVAGLETVIGNQDKKLGLRTGFNYAQRSTTYLTREETIAQVNFLDEEVNDLMAIGSNGPFYEARAELNSNPIKYHFLEVPIFVDYKLSKKWSLHSGLSAKTLLLSSTQDFGVLNGVGGRNRDAALFTGGTESNAQEDTNISYFAPRKFNLGGSVGVNFKATQRLALQARFSQNLLDIYSELPRKQRSSSIGLGLSWRLK